MSKAIQLAKKGLMTVSPNPMVGAVLVKNGKIIGEGYHVRKGEPHAEVNAINSASESVEGATLYCSLEPCCHTNKLTPPCTDLLIDKKIGKVVVASLDPNPEVAGKGLKKLREAGIEVSQGILEKEADDLNKIFFKNMNSSLPYVHMKAAITLDGRVCSSTGNSKWISSEEARFEVHRMREQYDAVMIGKGTLELDNPRLNARLEDRVTKEPIRIIVGNLSEEDLEGDIFRNNPTILNIYSKQTAFKGNTLKTEDCWGKTLKKLFEKGICSILIEGGSGLMSSIIEEDVWDEATFYVTQKLIGNGKCLFESDKNKEMENAISFSGKWRTTTAGEAVLEIRK